jgi:hypothetical protein
MPFQKSPDQAVFILRPSQNDHEQIAQTTIRVMQKIYSMSSLVIPVNGHFTDPKTQMLGHKEEFDIEATRDTWPINPTIPGRRINHKMINDRQGHFPTKGLEATLCIDQMQVKENAFQKDLPPA